MIATAIAKQVEPEQIMTIFEMLTTYRVRCGSYHGDWVAWCWVHGKRIEAPGVDPITAVSNLRPKIEDVTVLREVASANQA